MLKLGFIGAGKMAQAIISGLDRSRMDIAISGHEVAKTVETATQLGITAVSGNMDLVTRSEIIILAVKPQVLPSVLAEIAPALSSDKTLVSIAAGLTLADLAALTSSTQPFVRAMPNINATIQRSTTAIVKNTVTSNTAYTAVKDIFAQVGTIHELAEKDFPAFMALAGSSPAYIDLFIDALARAGVLHGLSKALATQIVAETIMATSEHLLVSGKHPQALADDVASPGGTTIAGIASLEATGFTHSILAAITATIDKEKSLKD